MFPRKQLIMILPLDRHHLSLNNYLLSCFQITSFQILLPPNQIPKQDTLSEQSSLTFSFTSPHLTLTSYVLIHGLSPSYLQITIFCRISHFLGNNLDCTVYLTAFLFITFYSQCLCVLCSQPFLPLSLTGTTQLYLPSIIATDLRQVICVSRLFWYFSDIGVGVVLVALPMPVSKGGTEWVKFQVSYQHYRGYKMLPEIEDHYFSLAARREYKMKYNWI